MIHNPKKNTITYILESRLLTDQINMVFNFYKEDRGTFTKKSIEFSGININNYINSIGRLNVPNKVTYLESAWENGFIGIMAQANLYKLHMETDSQKHEI